jgi:hypothetical protein
MEPAKLETSIGSLYVAANTRDCFNIRSFPSFPHAPDGKSLYLWLGLERCGDSWEFEDRPPKYRPAENESFSEVPLPPALADEILARGREWADAHPEAFEKAARAEFDDHIMYITRDTFEELMRIFTDAQKEFRRILGEPEFVNHASTPLRRRVQKEGPTAARNAPPGQRRGEGH